MASQQNADAFDVEKAVAAVAFLVEKTRATMYGVMKMLYLADKLHLERYGRFISGDRYVAMEQGPVPSRTYNMVKHVRGDELRHPDDVLACSYFDYVHESHEIRVRSMPDIDELSDTDIECLDAICKIYREAGKRVVVDMSHDDAWRNVWNSVRRRISMAKALPMPLERIAAELDEPEALLAFLRDPTPGHAEPKSSAT